MKFQSLLKNGGSYIKEIVNENALQNHFNFVSSVLFRLNSIAVLVSEPGCCICGKNRQEGKPFLSSKKYEFFFPMIFNIPEDIPSGDLCRACYGAIDK